MSLLRRRRRQPTAAAQVWAPGWDVPDRFNFTRDVIEARARDHTLRAYTAVDPEGIIDRRTFGDVAEAAARWAHALRSRAERGATVTVLVGTTPDAHVAILGALKGGLVVAPCPADLRGPELAFRLTRTGSALLVAPRSAEAEVEAALQTLGRPVEALYLDVVADELRRYRAVAPTEETAAAEPALVLFTAGDGAEPKAVVHTNAALWSTHVVGRRWLGALPGDLVWSPHRAGWPAWVWHSLFAPWSAGAEVVVHDTDAFDPDRRVDLLQRLGVTVLCQTPTEHQALFARGAIVPGAFPRLREVVSTGGPLPGELVERFAAASLALRDGLTQAECALVAGTSTGEQVEPGVLGGALPGLELSLLEEDGAPAARGTAAELCVEALAPPLPAGYLDEEGRLRPALDGDRYRTGDLCVEGEDGRLRFVARADDVIVSDGLRIGPVEIESALLSHPDVIAAAAVGCPDPVRGSTVTAFVTLREPDGDPTALAAALVDHVRTTAPDRLVPTRVEVIDDLPRSSTGLVRRSELRRREEARVAAAMAEATERARSEAERAEAEHRRRVAADEARHRQEQEEARAREEAERRRLVEEAEAERARAAAVEEAREAELRAEREAHERRAREEAERKAAEAARVEAEAERARREAEERARAAEIERAAAEQREQEREAAVRAAAARREREASERAARDEEERQAQQEAERRAAEAARLEAERAAAEQRTREEAEVAAERERAEAAERAAAEQRAREEAERRAAEAARLEAERAAAEQRARKEAEQHAREEAARHEAEVAAERERAKAAERAAAAERERAAAEQREAVAEATARRRDEERAARLAAAEEAAAERARLAQEAERARVEREAAAARERAERDAARRAEREAREREHAERERREQDARAEREAARRAEIETREREKAERAERERAEREQQSRAEREAAERAEAERIQRERAEREAAEQAEAERTPREKAERDAAIGVREREKAERAEREARARAERDAAKQAEAERKQREKTEREAAKQAEAERKQREKAEREAARRAEIEAREREKAERAEREAREKAEREAAKQAEQGRLRARLRKPAVKPAVPEPEDAGVEDTPIPGLVDRLRIYADGASGERANGTADPGAPDASDPAGTDAGSAGS